MYSLHLKNPPSPASSHPRISLYIAPQEMSLSAKHIFVAFRGHRETEWTGTCGTVTGDSGK